MDPALKEFLEKNFKEAADQRTEFAKTQRDMKAQLDDLTASAPSTSFEPAATQATPVVLGTDNAARDAATVLCPEPAVDLKLSPDTIDHIVAVPDTVAYSIPDAYALVEATPDVTTEPAVLLDVSSAIAQAQEVLVVTHEACSECIARAPVTYSTDCSNQLFKDHDLHQGWSYGRCLGHPSWWILQRDMRYDPCHGHRLIVLMEACIVSTQGRCHTLLM